MIAFVCILAALVGSAFLGLGVLRWAVDGSVRDIDSYGAEIDR